MLQPAFDTTPQRSEWLRSDLLFLKDALARGMSFAEVAAFLGRTEEEVRRKAEEFPFSPTPDILELVVFDFPLVDTCEGEPSLCNVEQVSFLSRVARSCRQAPCLGSSPKAFGNSSSVQRSRHIFTRPKETAGNHSVPSFYFSAVENS
jgi:hypothetical protein